MKKNDDDIFFYVAGGLIAAMFFLKRKKIASAIESNVVNPVMETIEQYKNRELYKPLFRAVEKLHGMPVGLLERVAEQESSFLDSVITGSKKSSAGAVGIMQIVPKWHPGVNPYDPVASIQYAGQYLKSLYASLGNDWKKALAAYNWGIGNVQKYGMTKLPTETKNYVEKITSDIPV